MNFQGIVLRACEGIAAKLPNRIIYRGDRKPYLGRYYLRRNEGPRKSDLEEVAASLDLAQGVPEKKRWWLTLPNVYLHQFLSGDEDEQLHNHPFEVMLSLVLFSGYLEERRMLDGTIQTKTVKPWSFNVIRADDFHRVELLDKKPCWTLFFAWNKTQSWGFWDRHTDQFTLWMDH